MLIISVSPVARALQANLSRQEDYLDQLSRTNPPSAYSGPLQPLRNRSRPQIPLPHLHRIKVEDCLGPSLRAINRNKVEVFLVDSQISNKGEVFSGHKQASSSKGEDYLVPAIRKQHSLSKVLVFSDR